MQKKQLKHIFIGSHLIHTRYQSRCIYQSLLEHQDKAQQDVNDESL